MSLKDLQIKDEYRSSECDILNEFYNPVLKESVLYKRAVGFFSSSVLIDILDGIGAFIRNNGHIKLVASPKLSDEDVKAIKDGYDKREIIKTSIEKELKNPIDDNEKNRYNILANLIAQDYIDVKIAVLEKNDEIGIYHEKLGVFEDALGNKIAFTGSMNETAMAVSINYETFDTYCSWTDLRLRAINKEVAFDKIWNNEDSGVKVYDFPEVSKAIIEKYKTSDLDFKSFDFKSVEIKPKRSFFVKPDTLNLYPYQEEAINNWFAQDCRGIFDMATGTGKTITALSAISRLSEELSENLAVIIVVPYQHLVEQWCEDIERYGVTPIKAYSNYPNWINEFDIKMRGYESGAIDNFCIITTNASYKTAKFQKELNRMRKPYIILADEAHNLGATGFITNLPDRSRFRLALSATIDRHYDDAGTKRIKDFFGDKCIEYSIDEAIRNNFLTKYKYFPVYVVLSDDEWCEYRMLSEKIAKYSELIKNQSPLPKELELLLIKRSRLIAGCRSKVDKLIEAIEPYKDKDSLLIYCGAVNYECSEFDNDDYIKQIDEVNQKLWLDLHMEVRKFTAEEDKETREIILSQFKNKQIQGITAIKCLDEGVNIPSIQTAFILASSTNPKEYIQRRGRVLRLYSGKEFAEIYDFVTLPRSLENAKMTPVSYLEQDVPLIKRELERMEDFAYSASNYLDIRKKHIDVIKEIYKEVL